MLVDRFGDPLGVKIPADSLMEWINEDNLKELERGIFTNPVTIQDAQSPTVAPSSLLSKRLKASGKLQLVNTMMDRLAIGHTLRNRAFVATTAPTNPIYDKTLLGLVSQPMYFISLVGLGALWSAESWRYWQQRMHPEEEAHHVGLFLPP